MSWDAVCEPWDEGLTWRSVRTVAPDELPMTVAHVRDQVLRVANGTAEDAIIAQFLAAAVDAFEKDTGRAAMPQTWQIVLSRFPYGSRPIVIPRPPLMAVESVAYIDTDGVEQVMASSPADYQVIASGEFTRAQIVPLYGEVWPTTRCQPDAVTVTFTCGYENGVPDMAITGIGLMVAELYKQRSLSVQSSSPSVLQLDRFWRKVQG